MLVDKKKKRSGLNFMLLSSILTVVDLSETCERNLIISKLLLITFVLFILVYFCFLFIQNGYAKLSLSRKADLTMQLKVSL